MNDFSRNLGVDSAVAESFYGNSARNGPARAERELMVAVLSDAIECYWKYQKARKRSGMRLFRDAESWIFADNERQAFSFRNVCETLQLDPNYIRRGIISGRDSTPDDTAGDASASPRGNIKRKLKSGREWKGTARLSRQRVRPLKLRSSRLPRSS
jgi:hypothetical protein